VITLPAESAARRSSFDPVAVGRHECDAWIGHYRSDWPGVLRATVRLVRAAFGLSWPRAALGAGQVMRANRAWARERDGYADATALMARFYAVVARECRLPIDPAVAARLELAWWREHRALRRSQPGPDPVLPVLPALEPDAAGRPAGCRPEDALIRALTVLYAYVYSCDPASVRAAAQWRAHAMNLADAWGRAGCVLTDPLLREMRLALVRSCTLLADAMAAPDAGLGWLPDRQPA
jgi:hypothetical protein